LGTAPQRSHISNTDKRSEGMGPSRNREVHDSLGMVNSQKENTITQEEKSGEGDLDVEDHCPGGDNLTPIASNTEHELQNMFGSHFSPTIGSPLMVEGKVNMSGEELGVLVSPLVKSLKRSKRREGSVDEDSSA
jgi:hypothetical protein